MPKQNKAATQVSYGDHHHEAVEALVIRGVASPGLSQDRDCEANTDKVYGTSINADIVKAAIKAARACWG